MVIELLIVLNIIVSIDWLALCYNRMPCAWFWEATILWDFSWRDWIGKPHGWCMSGRGGEWYDRAEDCRRGLIHPLIQSHGVPGRCGSKVYKDLLKVILNNMSWLPRLRDWSKCIKVTQKVILWSRAASGDKRLVVSFFFRDKESPSCRCHTILLEAWTYIFVVDKSDKYFPFLTRSASLSLPASLYRGASSNSWFPLRRNLDSSVKCWKI